MALGEIRESLGDAIQNFWRGALEIHDARMNLCEHFALGQVLRKFDVGLFERAAEAAHSITILADVFALGFVEDVADIGAREAAGLDESNEVFDQVLEEDVVLPERVIAEDALALVN